MSVYRMVLNALSAAKQTNVLTDRDGNYLPNLKELQAEGSVNEFLCLKEALENTKHTFVFIITKDQWPSWRRYCMAHNYDEHTLFEMPYFVHNFNYTAENGHDEHNGGGRRLRLVILKGKGTQE